MLALWFLVLKTGFQGDVGCCLSQDNILVLLKNVEAGWLGPLDLWSVHKVVSLSCRVVDLAAHYRIHRAQSAKSALDEFLLAPSSDPSLDHP